MANVTDRSYYIPPDANAYFQFVTMGELLECRKCKRKILVEMAINGTVHHLGTSATCADCLEIFAEFRQKFPQIAEQLDRWRGK